MGKQSSGNRRLNQQAREVISDILLFEVSDPRLGMVSINSCRVSFDRSYADIYYSTESCRYSEVEAALKKAAGHIRSCMARKLSWRVVPQLRFHLDTSVDEAERIESVLRYEAARGQGNLAEDD